jgi:hypothetical protein
MFMVPFRREIAGGGASGCEPGSASDSASLDQSGISSAP